MTSEMLKSLDENQEFSTAMNKTWTRIGMGKVALANFLVGRPPFTQDELSLLSKAIIPNDN
ncbi:MAG: hypothetical protein ACFFB3_04455 [Candidatus Hodarchaeota archaeon]